MVEPLRVPDAAARPASGKLACEEASMAVAHRTGRCDSGGVSIFYRRLGTPGGIPALFVHGLSYFSWDWLEAAAALGTARECAAMDMRGFGDSDWSPAKDYGVPAMASDIGAVLEHLDWPRVVLVGHSMGGRNSAYFAARNPQRVAGLVLVDYSPEIAPAGSQRVARTVASVPERFPEVADAMRHFGAGPEKRERFEAYLKPVEGGFAIKRDTHFRDQFRKVLETGERPGLGVDMWQVLAEIACPLLVVRGSRSDLFGPESVPKVAAANARIRLVEVDAGHNVAVDNLPGLLAALEPFLAELAPN
jgi:pimeloyl-ACP methyl ester carboxylesterase